MQRTEIGILLVSVGATCLFLIDFCGAVFGCGCRSLWAGAAAHCNIHTAGVPHCPWCAMGNGWMAVVFAGIVAPQAVLSVWPRRWPWGARLGLALLAFPLMGGVGALLAGWMTGYW